MAQRDVDSFFRNVQPNETIEIFVNNLFKSTISYKIFETNSSFHLKQCTTEKF